MIPEGKEEWQGITYPETVLQAVSLLYYYMNRTPGKPRLAIGRQEWAMAARLLGLHGQDHRWSLGDYADERLRRFGIEPITSQVVDKKRWAIAWNIITTHRKSRGGCPWRISAEEFEKAFDEAMRRPTDVPEAAPITYTRLRAKKRPYKDAYNVKPFKPKEPVKPTNQSHSVLQSRAKRYLAELEES